MRKRNDLEFKNSIDDDIYLEVVYDDNKRAREYQHIYHVSSI
jgi:hypothetical protein